MSISVIVPAYNNAEDLQECVSAIKASDCPDLEIIVVDDASTDETPRIAARLGARVLRLMKNSGVSAARNYGARHASGEILFFVDADVVVTDGAVHRVMKVFEERPGLAAVFGSYDARPRAKGVVSQYRNLLHHFVHQHGNSDASTFWAGCGAIRRAVFESVGGFDEKRFPYPSIEDIELGYRVRQAGHKILLDKSLQATHLKRWTLRSVIRTDIVCRALPWSRLILESGKFPHDLNLKGGQRLSVALVGLAVAFMLLSTFQVKLLAFSSAAVLSVIVLNRELYTFFFRQRGLWFAATCVPLHLFYFLYSGLSYLYAWTAFRLRRGNRYVLSITRRNESKSFSAGDS